MAKNMIANCEELRRSFPAAPQTATIGIDLGDRYSHCCFLGQDGAVLSEGRVRTTPEAMASHFKDLPSSRIAIEVGAHSRWVSQLLQDWVMKWSWPIRGTTNDYVQRSKVGYSGRPYARSSCAR
jgi:hypothetical protein